MRFLGFAMRQNCLGRTTRRWPRSRCTEPSPSRETSEHGTFTTSAPKCEPSPDRNDIDLAPKRRPQSVGPKRRVEPPPFSEPFGHTRLQHRFERSVRWADYGNFELQPGPGRYDGPCVRQPASTRYPRAPPRWLLSAVQRTASRLRALLELRAGATAARRQR